MSPTTVYLITGANRSIGFALVNELAAKHNDVVIYGAVRDPASAMALKELASKYPGKVEIIKYVSGDEVVTKELAKTIQEKHGRVDTVIASAGASSFMGTAAETPADKLREHFEVNVTGILILFQDLLPLLKASKSPRFVPLSSGAASLTAYITLPAGYTCYGASKAALNYISRKIHFENEWITCFPLAPGIVRTDMAIQNRAMDKTGTLAQVQDAMQIEADVAATLLVDLITNSTREKDGGEFINIDGSKIPW